MRPPRRAIAAVFAATALVGGAAATATASVPPSEPSPAESSPGDSAASGESTPAQAIADSLQLTLTTSFQMELYTDITGTSIDLTGDTPIATGVYTIEGVGIDIDLAPVFNVLGIDVAADGVVNLVAAGSGLYIKAPLVSSLVAALGPEAGPLTVIGELGDQWGFIDLATLADDPDLADLDIADMLQLLAALAPQALGESLGAEGIITEIGTDTIDGTPVVGYSVTIPDDTELPGLDGAGSVGDASDALGEVPIELWIGDDGYLHRVAVAIDPGRTGDLAGSLVGVDGPIPDTGVGLGTRLRIDLSGFDDSSLTVEEPTEATDITAILEELTGALGGVEMGSSTGTDDGADDEPKKLAETQPITIEGRPLPAFPMTGADPAEGLAAPTLSGLSFDGTPVAYESGTPTLVVFLAHWCPHCQAQVPVLVDWAEAGEVPEGLDVLAVATTTSADRDNFPPSAWLESEEFPWPVIADSARYEAADAYGLQSFPYFVLLDADGNVVARASGEMMPAQLTDFVSAALP